MFSFEIESQVTWNSLPILPSIFGLSSQNIVIPHYSCHSVENTSRSYFVCKGSMIESRVRRFNLLQVQQSIGQFLSVTWPKITAKDTTDKVNP